ncbi:MAG: DUF4330 family protein [Oscillospiraceae bacterium]|jgi:hypothetical protein|nr:DUF4330 family protein [Oscillospiraceae bacterium]
MNNKEKKPRFNIIDLIIILFIAAALVGIAMRYNLADTINLNANGETFEIEFISGWAIQEASQKYFEPGVAFYINIDSVKIGEIKEILDIRNPAIDYVTDLNGNIVETELPGKIDVIGVMKSTGRITKDGEYMINGNYFVAPNKEMLIHTGYLEGWVRIISIKKADE